MQYDALMDVGAAELASAIGRRVKLERQGRRWTLDQLADVAGVSRRMVVNVEQGVANPSVAILLRLSDALGIGLPALVEPPQARPVKVTRAGQGAVLWSSEAGGTWCVGSRHPATGRGGAVGLDARRWRQSCQ